VPLAFCLAALLFGPSAGAGAPKTVRFCGANQVCVQASNLTLAPGGEWLRGVDVTVQLKLAASVPQFELKQAAIFATRYLDWGVQPLYNGDGRFEALDGPQRQYRIHG
jgi:hypothetical protein